MLFFSLIVNVCYHVIINNQKWSSWSIYWSLWKQHLKAGFPSLSLLWRVQMITIDLPPVRLKSKPQGEKKILIITEPESLWLKLWLVWFSSYFHYAAQYSFSYKSERMQEKMALLKTIYTDLENMHFKMETNSAVTDNRGAQRQIIN